MLKQHLLLQIQILPWTIYICLKKAVNENLDLTGLQIQFFAIDHTIKKNSE